MTVLSPAIADILTFWFDDPNRPHSEYGQPRQIWFRKNPTFDQQVRSRFETVYDQARQGQWEAWLETSSGSLALVVLLDQFPRNMFRGSARSFEADSQARSVARRAIAQGFDRARLPVERQFFYLPFEHSEDLADQDYAVTLFESLVKADPGLQSALDYAYRHRQVIAQFGRFPHRNPVLGRQSTQAELSFLAQPGSRF